MTIRARAAVGVATAALLVPGAVAAAAGGQVPVTVKPKTGGTHSRFVISFRAPAATNSSSITRRYEVGAATRKSPGVACSSTVGRAIASATLGERVNVTLTPGGAGSWCGGTYKGVVDETIRPRCLHGEVCPMYIAVATIGKFSFRVT